MSDTMTGIRVAFTTYEDRDHELLGVYLDVYPSYHIGERVWLEVVQTPLGHQKYEDETLELHRYRIVGVEHSVRRTFTDHIHDAVSLEIIVELDDEE